MQATKLDLQVKIGTLRTAIDAFEARLAAKIDAQTERLTIRLGGILIAGMIATGLLLYGTIPLLVP